MQIAPAADNMEGVSSATVSRYFPEFTVLCLVLLVQAAGAWWILRGPMASRPGWARRMVLNITFGSFAIETFGSLLRFDRVERHLPPWFAGWGRGLVMAWALYSVLLLVLAVVVWRFFPLVARKRTQTGYSAGRRNFLLAAKGTLFAAPAAVVGYGVFIERLRLSLREETIAVPGLPQDLHGLRLVQLTDIHLSPFLSERELGRAVAMANETQAHLALVTGDLITSKGDPLDACLRHLSGLRADAGVLGCLGNHEVNANAEDYVAKHGARLGLRFLRGAAAPLRFGNASLNVAGVDYQRTRKPYLVGADKLVRPGAFNLLLSHNPDVFPVAARQGYHLTLSGHTHGGQVRVEILQQDLNMARFFTRYVDGLYREGAASIFVSRGIGTIGIPARLGSTPEVALLRLCRT